MASKVRRLVSPTLYFFFFMLAILLFVITAFLVLSLDVFNLIGKENQEYIRHWEQIAPQLAFEFNSVQGPESARSIHCTLTGKVHQFNCRVLAEKVAKRDYPITHTVRLEVDLPQPLNMDLNISHQGTKVPFFKILNKKELALDDEFFDNHFFVQGRDAATVNQFLTVERKSTIYNTKQSIAPFGFEITDSMIVGGAFQKEGDLQQIIHVMKQLVAVAKILSDHPPEAEAQFWNSAS